MKKTILTIAFATFAATSMEAQAASICSKISNSLKCDEKGWSQYYQCKLAQGMAWGTCKAVTGGMGSPEGMAATAACENITSGSTSAEKDACTKAILLHVTSMKGNQYEKDASLAQDVLNDLMGEPL